VGREYDVPPMVPSMNPIPEYRPSTPQSVAQPEMIDTVKTYDAQEYPDPSGKRREDGCERACIGLKENLQTHTGMTDESSPDSLHDRY
jgi:hypothetical protein